jgi:hypothetical protein
MTAWGVGAIPFNVHAKLECDEDLGLVIQATWAEYAKTFKGVWMERDWKFASNKIVWRKESGLLTQYHDSKMIRGR